MRGPVSALQLHRQNQVSHRQTLDTIVRTGVGVRFSSDGTRMSVDVDDTSRRMVDTTTELYRLGSRVRPERIGHYDISTRSRETVRDRYAIEWFR